MTNTDGFHGMVDAGINFFFIQTHIGRPEGNIISDGGAEKLIIRILKKQSGFFSNHGQIFFIQDYPVYEDLSFTGCQNSQQQMEKR